MASMTLMIRYGSFEGNHGQRTRLMLADGIEDHRRHFPDIPLEEAGCKQGCANRKKSDGSRSARERIILPIWIFRLSLGKIISQG